MMRARWFRVGASVVCGLMFLAAGLSTDREVEPTAMTFEAVEVYIDSGTRALAAFQFELLDRSAQAKIVGVEGGDHPVFREPPYYDPAALQNRRIVIAAFDTGSELPVGKTRVATLHMVVPADRVPDYAATLTVAGTTGGADITKTCKITWVRKKG